MKIRKPGGSLPNVATCAVAGAGLGGAAAAWDVLRQVRAQVPTEYICTEAGAL